MALDSVFAARQLSDAAREAQTEVGVLAEFDAGLGRVGVAPGEPLLQLAQSIRKLPHLSFEGLAFYPGHIKDLDEPGLRALAQLSDLLRSILADFRRAGIEVPIVSGGSTPTLFHSHEIHGLNEIRPGTYVFNDVNTLRSGGCTLADCAATILATVVSVARPGQMIIDGGSKTFSSDRPVNSAEVTFGHVVEAPGARFHKMNEEHGFIDLTRAEVNFRRATASRDSQPHLRGRESARAGLRPARRHGGRNLERGRAREAAIACGAYWRSARRLEIGACGGCQPPRRMPSCPTYTIRSSLGVGVRIRQPVSVTTTVSSMRMPPKSSR